MRVETPHSRGRATFAAPATGYVGGLSAPLRGFAFMCRRPGLWLYAILPVVLNTLITLVVLVGLVYGWHVAWGHIVRSLSPAWYSWIVKALLIVLAVVSTLALAVLAFLGLQAALCCLFYDMLAEKVELELGTRREDLRSVPVLLQIGYALWDLLVMLGMSAATQVLHVVPVIGSAAALCVTAYVAAFTCGVGYLDYPLALRGLRRSEKLAFARAHRAWTLGLGTAVLLFSFVPLFGSAALATAVVGAVLVHKQLAGPAGVEDGRTSGGR